MNVTCPAGAYPGDKVAIQSPDGRQHMVEVPSNVGPGQNFVVRIPRAPSVPGQPIPVATARPVNPAQISTEVSVERSRRSFMPPPRDADMYEQLGYCNSCCMIFIGIVTIIVTIFLSTSVNVYFQANGKCYWTWTCCYYPCTRYCYVTTCNTLWLSTRPISQDMLPEPEIDPIQSNSTHKVYLDEGGDGILDYWSLMVAVTMGPIAALVMIIIACTPLHGANQRKLAGACTAFAFVLHLTAVICLGVQFFETHSSYTVYNRFKMPQYVEITDKSIAGYMRSKSGDDYKPFANLVITAFTFMLCMVLQECCWMAALAKGDARLVRTPHMRGSFF